MAHIIVFGNEKGGSGKTTTAMHLITSLIKLGFKVASIDIDSRQQSLSRYIENRISTGDAKSLNLETSKHTTVHKSKKIDVEQAINEEKEIFLKHIDMLRENSDFIIIDTPGSDTQLSRLAHSYADTLITPINDSFIDVDLIGKININHTQVISPGIYSAMFWEQKLKRAARDKAQIRWIIVRNRIAYQETFNQRNIILSLEQLAKKFGFTVAPGFGDRVIFKELFLHGLTLHDAHICNLVRMSPSLIAARLELREFIKSLNFNEVNEKLKDLS